MMFEYTKKYIGTIMQSGITKGIQNLPKITEEFESAEKKLKELETKETGVKLVTNGICGACLKYIKVEKHYCPNYCPNCGVRIDWRIEMKAEKIREALKHLSNLTCAINLKDAYEELEKFEARETETQPYDTRTYHDGIVGQCPCCHNDVFSGNCCYCNECGQKLDWNDDGY